jgi:N-acetylglucosaminyldiphosphoundecaprenol N-acetyl-beta-D-mannosaminyltransferase
MTESAPQGKRDADMDHALGPAIIHRSPVLGSFVDSFTATTLVSLIMAAVRQSDRKTVIVNHNLHSLALHARDDKFRSLYRRMDYCFIDGAPVVWLARAGGADVQMENRVGVLDWIWPLLEAASRQRRHIVHVGSGGEVIEKAKQEIQERVPGIELTFVSGYFDIDSSEDRDRVVRRINEANPDILLAGMGMPRQEHWLLDELHRLDAPVLITVGGIMGYLGGDRPTAPRWLGPIGLEWLYRLLTEPRRLWKRYLVEPLALVPATTTWIYSMRRNRSSR